MRLGPAAALLCVVAMVGCGDSSTEAPAPSPAALSAPATTVASPVSPAPSGADDYSTPGPTSGPSPSPTAAPEPTAAATTVAPPPTSPPAASAQGTGLIHGTVRRECGTNPASGAVGGGCFSQGGGVAGVPVELRSLAGAVLGTTSSDATGVFTFQPSAGRYVIREAATGVSQERDVVAGQTTFVGLVLPPPTSS